MAKKKDFNLKISSLQKYVKISIARNQYPFIAAEQRSRHNG